MVAKHDCGHISAARIRVGISSCLLGEEVRYDAGHKRDPYIASVLGRFFEFVPACPEVAIGLGVPRPPIRLVGDPAAPRALGVNDASLDVTERLDAYARSLIDRTRSLSGYIFKRGSPSCGMERVKVYGPKGTPERTGRGIFAKRLMEEIPSMPAEEEGRLTHPVLKENFVMRVYVYDRWQRLRQEGLTAGRLVAFHTRHKMLIRAHDEQEYRRLGGLVANAEGSDLDSLAGEYISLLMTTLESPATRSRHSNVLTHLAGYLKRDIDSGDEAELVRLIGEYRLGHVPLAVPVDLLKHHFRRRPDPDIGYQHYLDPYPEELKLRNFI